MTKETQPKSFGQQVKAKRKHLGLTQLQLAEKLGIDASYVTKIERGRLQHPPSEKLIRELASILGENADGWLVLAAQFDSSALRESIADKPQAVELIRLLQEGDPNVDAFVQNLPDSTAQELKQIIIALATGLLLQKELIDKGEAPPVTILHPLLQLSWDRLAFSCLKLKATPPRHLSDFLFWLHQPLEQWSGLGKYLEQEGIIGPLLYLGIPTELCSELASDIAQAPDHLRELEDIPFKEILEYCHKNSLEEPYRIARKFVVENPYLADGKIEIFSLRGIDDKIRSWLAECYEPIPASCKQRMESFEKVALCPRCGWPIEWQDTVAHCYSELCTQLAGNLQASSNWQRATRDALRTKRGIQSSIVAPEKPLLDLVSLLIKRWKLSCELWPRVDKYDLHVEFTDGESWAIDMKDRMSPQQLAPTLHEFPPFPVWQRAFYVFPDYRNQSGYMTTIQNLWIASPQTSVMFVKDFLKEVEQRCADATVE